MRVSKKKVLVRNQPWKNKKRRRQERSKDDERSQRNHIPLDITLEILSRLPAKSIVRYQCVSKLWSSFTTLPSFINSFASRSSSQPPRLLLTFEIDYKQLVVSFPQNQYPDRSYPPVYGYHMTDISYYQYPQSESIQGLILLYEFQIFNPSLRQVFTLPHPKEHILIPLHKRQSKTYLGYDPLEGKHKVLCLYYGIYSVKPRVLTLGAQESWRVITKGRCPMHRSIGTRGRCVNGVIYYAATVDGQNIIMSFDVKSESFSTIIYPFSHVGWSRYMIFYEGRPAVVTDAFARGVVELYVLKDANGHEWTRHCFPCVRFKNEWRIYMQFKGITDAGELVFAPRSFVDSFYILYYDPRKNTTREAFFEGFLGEEFRGRPGVNNRTCTNVFPNHVESLVSL